MIKNNWGEFRDELCKLQFSGDTYIYLECTDRVGMFLFDIKLLGDEELQKALQVRVFNKDKEIRALRPYISSSELYVRTIDDTDGKDKDSFDQLLYLDIDSGSIRAGSGKAKTVNGGEYDLPVTPEAGLQLIVRNYIDTDEYEYGQAKVSDWRLCGFAKEGVVL